MFKSLQQTFCKRESIYTAARIRKRIDIIRESLGETINEPKTPGIQEKL